jgi:hypothetical protein
MLACSHGTIDMSRQHWCLFGWTVAVGGYHEGALQNHGFKFEGVTHIDVGCDKVQGGDRQCPSKVFACSAGSGRAWVCIRLLKLG